jgi:hypothetical protein
LLREATKGWGVRFADKTVVVPGAGGRSHDVGVDHLLGMFVGLRDTNAYPFAGAWLAIDRMEQLEETTRIVAAFRE